MKLIALLLLCNCTATYNAGTRRMAEALLGQCLNTNIHEYCFDKVETFCTSKGLEKGCGYGNIEQWIPKHESSHLPATDQKRNSNL